MVCHDKIGVRVKAVRVARGLTREALAARLGPGYYEVRIGRIESGEAPLGPNDLASIARHLDVDLELLTGDDVTDAIREELQRQGYETSPAEEVSPRIPLRGFFATDTTRLVQPRVAVVCAPLIGPKQVCAAVTWAREAELRVHHLLLISESASPEGVVDAAFTPRGAPPATRRPRSERRDLPFDIDLLRPHDVAASRIDLRPLADAVIAAATRPARRALVPPLSYTDTPKALLPADDAFEQWRTGSAVDGHLLLLGGPGAGKTCTLLRWAAAAAEAHLRDPLGAPCPMYVHLGAWWDATHFHARLLTTLQALLPHASLALIEHALQQGRLLLLLDGLDELVGPDPARLPLVERAIDPLLRLPCRVVMSARSAVLFSYDRATGDLGDALRPRPTVRVARLHRLSEMDVTSFLTFQRPDRGRGLLEGASEQGLGDLMRQPYVLDPLAYHSGAEQTPLLSRLIEPVYRQWVARDGANFGMHADELWDHLTRLASELRLGGLSAQRLDNLEPRLRDVLTRRRPRSAGSSRVIEHDGESVRFVHGQLGRMFFAAWVAEQAREGRSHPLDQAWLTHEDAAWLAGSLDDDAAVHGLRSWALDPTRSDGLRDIAAYGLGCTRHPDAVTTLRELRRRGGALAETATFSAMMLGDRDAVHARCDAATSSHGTRDRAVARMQLVLLAHHGPLIPSAARLDAHRALGRSQDHLDEDLLRLLLDPEEPTTTRSAAATALGHRRARSACDELGRCIRMFAETRPVDRRPDDLRLASAACGALEELTATTVIPPLQA
ncbi:MAG TPA: helix-turn-helix domain-containing protein [Myxococcota bacterium]|nr:helix-turn-helix domain-containing protein [Myxococcota bacterium]